jgi:hypothetical protein
MMSSDLEDSNSDDDCDSGNGLATPGKLNEDAYEEITVDLTEEASANVEPQETLDASFSPRSYQLEMLEESLRHNIIVAVGVSRCCMRDFLV